MCPSLSTKATSSASIRAPAPTWSGSKPMPDRPLGSVKVANEVIANIASLTACQVQGIVGMYQAKARDGHRVLPASSALKVLFELENAGGDAERSLQYHVAESRADAEVADFARTLIQGVREHQPEIDAELKQASNNWGLDQMAKVERTLLRIASFEILYLPSVPLKAAINESIELAKTFGGPDSGKFVNGILGRIAADAEIRHDPAVKGEGNG